MTSNGWRKLPIVLAALSLFSACGGEVELAGTVERKVFELATPISEVIVELPIAEGQRVEAGQIVVQLDTEVAAAELRASEAANAAAAAALVEAEGEFQRQEKLRRSRVTAPQALDAARRKRDEAVAQAAEREARIAQAKKRLENLTIRAHAAGIVDQLPYEVGERAPAGGVVAVVTADAKPWVRIWLPARAVARIGSGAQAKKRLENLTIRAHAAGVVDQLPYEVGERAPAGGVVAVVTADAKPWVRIWLPAREVARIDAGSGATVRVEGLEAPLRGTVTHVSREPEFTPHYALTERESAHLVYESRIRLDDAPQNLRAGLPAQISLDPPSE